jgi:hypothetical protein
VYRDGFATEQTPVRVKHPQQPPQHEPGQRSLCDRTESRKRRVAPRLGEHDRPGCVDQSTSDLALSACAPTGNESEGWAVTDNRYTKSRPWLHPIALIESPVVAVEGELAVEEACDVNPFLCTLPPVPVQAS